ncbi:MAG: hypothetical protein LIQ31_13645 [Planctomycetes bacterium]|nr:hypothetical protein [Planctomycetota bacterium]
MSEINRFLNVPILRNLNNDEKERISYFLESPAKGEFFILLQMLGKTPAQVRSLMIDEFIRRFGLEAHSDQIGSAFPSKRSWRAMDVALAEFSGSMGVEEHVQFWDRMRYVLNAIPQRRDYGDNYSDPHDDKRNRPKRGWDFMTCKLCWRRVAYNPGVHRKTGSLCFKHNLPAMHPIYRKHRRLLYSLSSEQQPIVKKLMALAENHPAEGDSQAIVYSQLTTTDGCLPRLAAYMNGTGHDGTHEGLLWAFHGPASDIEDSRYREALGEYIKRALEVRDILDPAQPMPIFTMDELSRAEAWLTLLERDGRMKKS